MGQHPLGIYLLGPFEIAFPFFLPAGEPKIAQEQVRFQAVRQLVQYFLAGVRGLHDLPVAPVGFGQRQLQVNPLWLFV